MYDSAITLLLHLAAVSRKVFKVSARTMFSALSILTNTINGSSAPIGGVNLPFCWGKVLTALLGHNQFGTAIGKRNICANLVKSDAKGHW
jgi:hypothetical protein